MTQRRTHSSPFSFRAISRTAMSRTSTKSYPPRTAKGSLPARKDFAIEVKLPPCMSPGPMMPEGKTKNRNPLRCKGLRAFCPKKEEVGNSLLHVLRPFVSPCGSRCGSGAYLRIHIPNIELRHVVQPETGQTALRCFFDDRSRNRCQ